MPVPVRGAFAALFLVLGLALSAPGHAHKVNLFANVEGDRISIEGYFADGKRAQNSQVTVFSPTGEKLVEGRTDDEGVFSFKIPQNTDLRISLYAGMGHRTEYTVKASELPGGAEATGPAAPAGGEQAAAETPAAEMADDSAPDVASGLSANEIRALVQQAVGEGLNPVMRNLSELKEQRTFSDIVGGVGFIFGLIGIFFYLKARRTLGTKTGAGTSG